MKKPNLVQTIYTAAGKDWIFFRIGDIVYMTSPNDISSAAKGNNTLFTIDAIYRPVDRLVIAAGNSVSMFMNVRTDGECTLYAPNAITAKSNGAFAGCWIAQQAT